MNSGGVPGGTGRGSVGVRRPAGAVGACEGTGASDGEGGGRVTGVGVLGRARLRARRGAVRRAAGRGVGFRRERAPGAGARSGLAASAPPWRRGTSSGSLAVGATVAGRPASPARRGRWSGWARANSSIAAATTATASAAADRAPGTAGGWAPWRVRASRLRSWPESGAPASIAVPGGSAAGQIGSTCRRASPHSLTSQAPSDVRNTLRRSCDSAIGTDALGGSGIALLVKRSE